MNSKMSGRIIFLDYMRVFAFLTVLIGHKLTQPLQAFITDASQHATLRLIAELIYPLCHGGAAGVVVFFLTSGYIITHVLQGEAALEFIVKRIFRIYPLYITAVILELYMWNRMNGTPIPSVSVLIPQLLLIGDFFRSPHTLAGVEWTLRIEIIFYIYMALIKILGGFKKQKWLPWVMFASACILYKLPQIPGEGVWAHGYFNLYAPFLLMGALIYLIESDGANKLICIAVIGVMFIAFLVLISKFHPAWSQFHYGVLALGIFLMGWIFKHQLPDSKILRGASDLTYSVYIFHNWLWIYLAILVEKYSFDVIPFNFQIFVILIIICYVMHKTVEVQGIKLGKKVLLFFRNYSKSPSIIINASTAEPGR